jgi:hypothetical protein
MPYWIFHSFFNTFRFGKILFRFVSFDFVSFRFDRFRFVSFDLIPFRFVSISFRTLHVPPLMMCFLSLHSEAKDYCTKPEVIQQASHRTARLNQDTLFTMSVRSWSVAIIFSFSYVTIYTSTHTSILVPYAYGHY